MRDGRPFYRWHCQRISDLLRESGLTASSRDEQQAREIARELLYLQRQETSSPQVVVLETILWDDIPPHLVPLVNRFLAEMGR
jgi:hypothetical protein